jgi:thioredoxin-like negative regulator of GroEL
MKDGLTHDELEQLLGRQEVPTGSPPAPSLAVIYFTAKWCGACKKLDLAAIEAALPEAAWYKCDVDANTYSPGYCGIRSIPAFLVVRDKKPVGPLGSALTEKVVSWLQQHRSSK